MDSKRSLTVVAAFGEDLQPVLAPGRLDARLADAGTALVVTRVDPPTLADLPATLDVDPTAQVLLLSLAGLTGDNPAACDGEALLGAITSLMTVARARACTVIVANASTIDQTHAGTQATALELALHRLAGVLLTASQRQGISVLDVDRCAAEVGAEAHVTGSMRYSDAMHEILADELVHILGDYGLFDDRPLVPQIGRR